MHQDRISLQRPAPPRLPKLPPNTLVRPRLLAALDECAPSQTRLVIAPPGFGKTTLVRHYLSRLAVAFGYVAFEPDDTAEQIFAKIGGSVGMDVPAGGAEAFLDALALAPAQVVVFDDADFKARESAELVRALIEHMPEQIDLIVCARSRSVVAGARALVSGGYMYLGADDLAFSPAEISQLCDLHGVAYAIGDIERLARLSDGWPIVISLGVRTAASENLPAATMYESWLRKHAETFRAFVLEEAGRTADGDMLRRLLFSGESFCTIADWETLERAGLFVRRSGERFDVYRSLLDVFAPSAATIAQHSKVDALPMVVTVLGEFTVTIGGRKIRWIRRKDARVFKYLLLKPGGTATRQELLDVFWPGRERQGAITALRTTCSNIRHAIRDAVGTTRAQLYFTTDLHVRVASERAISDLQRVRALAAAAHLAQEQGDVLAARTYLNELGKIETGDFIADAECALYESIARELAGLARLRPLRTA